MGVFRIVEPNLAAGAIVVVDNVAHFPTELRPIVERLSHAPYRATQLLLGSGTARCIGLDARTRFLEPLRAGLVRGEVGEDQDQFGRVAAPRVVLPKFNPWQAHVIVVDAYAPPIRGATHLFVGRRTARA